MAVPIFVYFGFTFAPWEEVRRHCSSFIQSLVNFHRVSSRQGHTFHQQANLNHVSSFFFFFCLILYKTLKCNQKQSNSCQLSFSLSLSQSINKIDFIRGNCSLFDVLDVLISPILWSVVVEAMCSPAGQINSKSSLSQQTDADRLEWVS